MKQIAWENGREREGEGEEAWNFSPKETSDARVGSLISFPSPSLSLLPCTASKCARGAKEAGRVPSQPRASASLSSLAHQLSLTDADRSLKPLVSMSPLLLLLLLRLPLLSPFDQTIALPVAQGVVD